MRPLRPVLCLLLLCLLLASCTAAPRVELLPVVPAALLARCDRPAAPDIVDAITVAGLLITYDDALADCNDRMSRVRRLLTENRS